MKFDRVVIITGTRKRIPEEAQGRIRTAIIWSNFAVLGDCPTGVDAYARAYVESTKRPHAVVRAQWEKLGKRAGPIRNGHMIALGNKNLSDHGVIRCAAFPSKGSRGTWDCARQAVEAGIETIIRLV